MACGCSGGGGGALRDQKFEFKALMVLLVGFKMLVMRKSRSGGLIRDGINGWWVRSVNEGVVGI